MESLARLPLQLSTNITRGKSMSWQQMIIAVLSTSAVTGGVIEIIRGIARFIGRKRDTGLAKLEREVSEIHETVQTLDCRMDESEETNRVILHDRIWAAYGKLHNKDSISVTDRANLDYIFKEYDKLKGNHKAKLMYEVLCKIPVEKETEI